MTGTGSHVDLLVALVARDAPGISAIVQDSGADVAATFGAFARRNQLSGFLHTAIADSALAATLPVQVQGEFRRRYAMELRKRELLDPELARLIDVFRAGRVECIVLKGPELAFRFYRSSGQRCYWDLDLLVRQDSLAVSRHLLEHCGFERTSAMLFGERISLSVAHALDFSRGEVGVDLHWKLSNHPSFRIDYGRVWARREAWMVSGTSCTVLSPDYALTLNLLSSLKDIERGAFRLRSFVDLWMILATIEADFEWDRFFAERTEENIRVICSSVLALFLVVFQAEARFPRLAHELSRQPGVLRVDTREAAIQLVEPAFPGLARRLWVSRLYQISRTRHLVWWAASLPVRLNVHKPGKMKRLSNTLGTWLRRRR